MDKKELSKILEGHRCWLNGEGGERANLRYADLMDAYLGGANLRGANLGDAYLGGVVGDGERIKSIFIERYPVAYTSEHLQIGCERHDITEWMGFDDERILEMDGDTALAWWKKYKGFIKQAIELSPAT